ncbi:MAG: hypothetical protein SCK29_12170 [Bacillota bacterium]|nr:hypothetical protein [Bacillota bacterium]MDW7684859.1 hypothetical protein [Bacillota bacterium]
MWRKLTHVFFRGMRSFARTGKKIIAVLKDESVSGEVDKMLVYQTRCC